VTTLQTQATGAAPRDRAARRPTVAPFRPHVVAAVFGRNVLGYFSGAAGYVFITLFVLVCSWFQFWQPTFFTNNLANLDPLNQWMPYILLFFVPAITMSIWAEERRQGTEELLLTLPARDVEVVLGKYLAALGIYTIALLFLALGHVALLVALGRPDLGVLAATFVGYGLMGALLIAVGMVASMLTSSVTVGFILGGLFCAVPVFAGGLRPLAQMLGSLGNAPGLRWFAGPLSAFGQSLGDGLEALSVPAQFRDFGAGVIALSGVAYFLGLAVAMLYLNMVLLGRRHWAGGRASAGRWTHAVARVAAVVVALASAAVLLGRWANARVDATEERLHTLAPASLRIVRDIPADRPVFIDAYTSPEVPRDYLAVRNSLLDTLKEFAAVGGGRVRLNLVETKPYTVAAREAERRFGITARRVPSIRDGRQGTEEIYLGVAFTSGLEQVVVPFFDRGLPVEYELTRSIRVVSGSKRKRVGVLETDAQLLGRLDFRMMAQEPEWAIVSELKKQYDVRPVSPDAPIPFEEVQSISATGRPKAGTFTLTFEGETTAPLPFDADGKAVAAALEKLSQFEPGDVQAVGGPLPKEPIEVTFTGRFTGRDVPDLSVNADFTSADETRAGLRVGTTTEPLDALLVAQASSLTEAQIENLGAFVRKGGPTLLLVDPLPSVNPTLAPSEPRVPGNPMMPPQASEPKGDLRPLLETLGVNWPSTQIVWDPYNPHQQFAELPVEYVFIARAATPEAFARDPITADLQEVFLALPGELRSREMPGDPEFTPLLQTDRLGGTIAYDELIERGPMPGMARARRDPRHVRDGRAHVVAARVRGKPRPSAAPAPGREVHVVLVADLDIIADEMFTIRRRPTEAWDILDFDNVTFVLNAVDSLAGDDAFLALRSKRPRFRTLERLEAESRRFIERSQAEDKKADDAAADELAKARKRLQEAEDAIRKNPELDETTKEIMVQNRRRVEQRRFNVQEGEIEARRQQAHLESRTSREESIAALQNRVRAAAILVPPLPVVLLGGFVFFVRSRRENQGANPERLA
jgi:ABC-type uncharacterized transport system involved in gliding motility auxiliary subunit/ABC-type transport system involved in multi-copper enzyme maturation permease subunit